MGKHSHKRKIDTTPQTTGGLVLSQVLFSSFDSIDAEYFAIVTHAVDSNQLRIFDARNNTVKKSYTSENQERFTCMSWGQIQQPKSVNGNATDPPPRKKSRSSSLSQLHTKVISLGLQDGSILLYSVSEGTVIKRMKGSHKTAVNDFVFDTSGKYGYSCDDLTIIEWDIADGREISTWKSGLKSTRRLALSYDGKRLLSAGSKIQMWDLKTKKIIRTFSGHDKYITDLMFSVSDDVCISAAENDRMINVWDCKGEREGGECLSVLSLDADIHNVSISPSSTVLAVSEDGILNIFDNVASSAHSSAETPPRKKKRKNMNRTASCVVKVLNEKDNSLIPILAASSMDESNNKMASKVVIVRGHPTKPIIETVRIVDKQTRCLIPEVILNRLHQPVIPMDESSIAAMNLKATHKQYDESRVKILENVNAERPEFTLIEKDARTDKDDVAKRRNSEHVSGDGGRAKMPNGRINSFSMTVHETPTDKLKLPNGTHSEQSDNDTPSKEKYVMANADSLQTILIQALHSNDSELFKLCLEHNNRDIIRNTVIKLPSQFVVQFLEKIVERFQTNPSTGLDLLEWIRVTLTIHSAYLMTVPDLTRKLSIFYQVLDKRLSIFPRLLNFYGRLDLAMQQISLRSSLHSVIEDTSDEVDDIMSSEVDISLEEQERYENEKDSEESSSSDESVAGSASSSPSEVLSPSSSSSSS
ncbi:4138_t:CDS:2 [Paraglomus occultum]|uniref:4138_t:CDS:1 n=1 Tax=Paraglomus occultum TaxID=144539 RepID=A0A9N9FGB7_9GLOM|nr:4138_t:CDS:2 [Paraglomus occultum]